MRPQIDAMFKKTSPAEHRVQGSAYPTPPVSGSSTPAANPLAANLLSSVAQQAQQASGSTSSPLAQSSTAKTPTADVPSLTPVTSVSYFNTILSQNLAVVANFTNTPGCAPCRAIKPAYESIAANFAQQYAGRGVRFVDVELGVGEGQTLASRHGVSATPTFIFFRDGKKVDEMKGADKHGLESKVETFLEDCFPRHPHRKLYLPAVEAVPTNPILSANLPNFTALIGKLEGFTAVSKDDVGLLKSQVVPVLDKKGDLSDAQAMTTYKTLTGISMRLVSTLKPEETFPAIDLWRVGLLNSKFVTALTVNLGPTAQSPEEPLSAIVTLAATTLKNQSSSTPKPFLLTVLRLLTNILAPLPLSNLLLACPSPSPSLHGMQEKIVSITVDSLLHPDQSVRSAAAGVAVNLAGYRHRLAKEQGTGAEDGDEHEWEVELASALIEAISKEADEDVGKSGPHSSSPTLCIADTAQLIASSGLWPSYCTCRQHGTRRYTACSRCSRPGRRSKTRQSHTRRRKSASSPTS